MLRSETALCPRCSLDQIAISLGRLGRRAKDGGEQWDGHLVSAGVGVGVEVGVGVGVGVRVRGVSGLGTVPVRPWPPRQWR